MSNEQQGRVPSRGELAMYGEFAYVVRQISTASVSLSEGREAIAARLREFYDEMHLPIGVDHSFGTAAEGTIRNEWEQAFTLVEEAEAALETALFGVTQKALYLQDCSREALRDGYPHVSRTFPPSRGDGAGSRLELMNDPHS